MPVHDSMRDEAMIEVRVPVPAEKVEAVCRRWKVVEMALFGSVLREGFRPGRDLGDEIREHVVTKIGAIARPEEVLFAADLPKTRSGKIMRRLLRDIAEGRALGDTTTLADPGVVQELKEKYEGESEA